MQVLFLISLHIIVCTITATLIQYDEVITLFDVLEQAVEQTIELPVIPYAMPLMWHDGNM